MGHPTYRNALALGCRHHLALRRLFLRRGRQDDAADGHLVAGVDLDEHAITHWVDRLELCTSMWVYVSAAAAAHHDGGVTRSFMQQFDRPLNQGVSHPSYQSIHIPATARWWLPARTGDPAVHGAAHVLGCEPSAEQQTPWCLLVERRGNAIAVCFDCIMSMCKVLCCFTAKQLVRSHNFSHKLNPLPHVYTRTQQVYTSQQYCGIQEPPRLLPPPLRSFCTRPQHHGKPTHRMQMV